MKTLHPRRWNKRFLSLAKEVASWSKDPSTKVGAVLVRPDRTVASVGYNGFPRGMADREDWLQDRKEKYPRTIHAEINAIGSCRDQTLEGYTIYSTFMPCDRCFVQLAGRGIIEFISPTPTPDELVRWGEFFANTKRFAEDMSLPIIEIPL